MARQVAIHWKDAAGECYQDAAPYWKESCFATIDKRIKRASDAGVWSILACRSSYGAGWGDENLFNSDSLRQKFMVMWQHLVQRYKSWDMIAAYEVLSEPRVDKSQAAAVNKFYYEACTNVQKLDPDTPCMIGPTSYYHIFAMNDSAYVKGLENVIYTFDYFMPEKYFK